ncbi:hypothetical protein KEF85_05610 [Methylomonas paludis]|uniref:Uncharacterized protein n=1 Tax=Methylomonas paludis TaxID=1173101 RepID=A0A975MR28_9GAMM|nr:hypothetical protein [Methylomonas paludis]QWF71934.1 hypothetical protein KEF85_05610 [Methylomonas paludis]
MNSSIPLRYIEATGCDKAGYGRPRCLVAWLVVKPPYGALWCRVSWAMVIPADLGLIEAAR